MEREFNAWDKLTGEQTAAAQKFSADYRDFLTRAKTERLAVNILVEEARSRGFKALADVSNLKPGDKVYYSVHNKALCLVMIGEHPLEQGFRIIGSHLDSPRLDLKQNPAYEESGLTLFKTHYYGGIKKYQWTTVPLALHGTVITTYGKQVAISVGEQPDDPVFTITDLLPHLAKEQMEKKAGEVIKGEGLNILIGSIPCRDTGIKERVKANILQLMEEQYGITEEDFVSAELEAVPAGPAREVGFDRGIIGGYGQDDRACVYTSFRALLELERAFYTSIALFTDKEETGSDGATGMKSNILEDLVAELIFLVDGCYNGLAVRRAMRRAKALSADGVAAYDPNFPDTMDTLNSAQVGSGVVITKYSGARGKYDTSDANAEFVGEVRRMFNEAGVVWQTGELGKVDLGGGGTIAQYMARYGMDVLDCGPALLCLHSPFELASVADIYSTYQAYRTFFGC